MKFTVLRKETNMNQMNKLSTILEHNCYEGGKTRGSGVQLWDGG